MSNILIGALALAGDLHLDLREPLNRQWTGERVSWPVSFANESCVAESVTLSGPDGQLACQLSEIIFWGESKFVREARLSAVVPSLPPLATLAYTVSFGTKAQAQPPTDLQLQAAAGAITLRSSAFGVRLTTTGTAPPIQQLCLADGTWLGGSDFLGAQATGMSSRVVANGPVFAVVESSYTFADGGRLVLQFELDAGAAMMHVRERTHGAGTEIGWQLRLGDGVQPQRPVMIFGQRVYAKERVLPAVAAGERLVSLSPWVGDAWFNDFTNVLQVPLVDRSDHLVISAEQTRDWVAPVARPPWARFDTWDFPTIMEMWAGWQQAAAPLVEAENALVLRFPRHPGRRLWSIGVGSDRGALLRRYRNQEMSVQSPLPALQEVCEMVLDWPESESHPYLFVDAAKLTPTKPSSAEALARVRADLNLLGCFDLFRHVPQVAADYDLVIDSPDLDAAEKRLLKAQFAYLAYIHADPFHWSFERGQCSGNPNMTVARITNIGLLGCALRGHPNSAGWVRDAVDWMDWWLEQVLDVDGGWPESSHYARVALAEMIHFAVCVRRGGYRDFFDDERFQRMALFYEKTLLPPDPLRLAGPSAFSEKSSAVRVGAPYGRGTRGDVWGLSGLVAAAVADSHPELSRIMSWCWAQSGYTQQVSHTVGGYDEVFLKPQLAQQNPGWRSEFLASLGYMLRDHLGAADEDALLLVSQPYQCPDGHIWPPDVGSIAKWYARGIPLAGNFRRVPEVTGVLTVNRVLLAANWDPAVGKTVQNGYHTVPTHRGFAALPGVDFVDVAFAVPELRDHHLKGPRDAPAFPVRKQEGDVPLDWTRQLIVDHQTTRALVMRDTVTSSSPTQWHFWLLSEKLGTPADAENRAAYLSDKPGANYQPARALSGDQFVAFGQFGMDLDIYVAAPAATPRFTLRYGTKGAAYGIRNFDEYQDLLQLQLEEAGTYFVAMVPRLPSAAPATFATAGEGAVIRIDSGETTSWCFLSAEPRQVVVDKVRFDGTAARVEVSDAGGLLSLGAAGSVEALGFSLLAKQPVQLQTAAKRLVISFAGESGETTVRCADAKRWRLAAGAAATRQDVAGGFSVRAVDAGAVVLELK